MPEIYVSTDIEADGRIPGVFSMLSFGSAAYQADGTLLGTFTANLEQLPEADAVVFPQLLGEAYRRVTDFQGIRLPILIVTSEFGTLSMWDWEIICYLKSRGVETIVELAAQEAHRLGLHLGPQGGLVAEHLGGARPVGAVVEERHAGIERPEGRPLVVVGHAYLLQNPGGALKPPMASARWPATAIGVASSR